MKDVLCMAVIICLFLTKITRWPIPYGTPENAEQAHLRLILEMDRILSLQM